MSAGLQFAACDCILHLAFLPSRHLPGGSYVKVWDLLGGGRLLAAFSSHAKTVTSLAFDGSSQRLLSGSLDQ